VIDFIMVHAGSYHWPTFNLADASITLGALLLAYDLIFAGRRAKEVTDHRPLTTDHWRFMYPILFRIWGFPINTYGVFLALAFLGAIFVTLRLAERDGLPKERIYDLCLWLLLSSLVGSKVLMFFTEPEYREHPMQLI